MKSHTISTILLLNRPEARCVGARRAQAPVREGHLPNGLEVILHEDHSTPIVAVNTWYKVGSADEKPGRTGFAHLFEHVMFMGSRNVPPVMDQAKLDLQRDVVKNERASHGI